MSFASPPRSVGTATRQGAGLSAATLVALGAIVCFVLSWPRVQDVWVTGTFFDTDDAMRMVEVRDWLAGQAWFDLTAHRLAPPEGVLMHWSRVVDLPLGFLLELFLVFTPNTIAERLTRIAFPLILQVGLVAATIATARRLAGPATMFPAMLLIVTSAFQFGQFVPGRIDHHAPQICLLMLMTGFSAEAVLRDHGRAAILAALCIVASLAISLENVPFIAVIVATLGLVWTRRGAGSGPVLRAFGLSLAGFGLAAMAVFVPPWRYAAVTPDSFSAPHLVGLLAGGAAFAVLGSGDGWLATPLRRGLALAAAACLVGAFIAVLCPGAFLSPYAAIDPVVRSVWLSRVVEAMPLPASIRVHPSLAFLILCPVLAGFGATMAAALVEKGRARDAWLMVLALMVVGLLGACWEVRVMSSTVPFASLGGAWAFAALLRRPSWRGKAIGLLAPCAVLAACSPIAWVMVPAPEEGPDVARSARDAEACRSAANMAPLAALGSGLVFAPIDSGAHILVHTRLAVLGAPYHRNNSGNRTVIDGFSAKAEAARTLVAGTGARFVALCPGQVQAEALTSRNPEGLAAHLLAGDVPPWLQPVDVPGTTYKVFAVR